MNNLNIKKINITAAILCVTRGYPVGYGNSDVSTVSEVVDIINEEMDSLFCLPSNNFVMETIQSMLPEHLRRKFKFFADWQSGEDVAVRTQSEDVMLLEKSSSQEDKITYFLEILDISEKMFKMKKETYLLWCYHSERMSDIGVSEFGELKYENVPYIWLKEGEVPWEIPMIDLKVKGGDKKDFWVKQSSHIERYVTQ